MKTGTIAHERRRLQRWAEPVYLDASALVKLFVPEPGSDDLNQELAGLKDVIVSDSALTEDGVSARAPYPRAAAHARPGTATVSRGVEAARLVPPRGVDAADPPLRAERLMLSLTVPLRTLDALHLATALDVQAGTIVTFIRVLRGAAASQGLFVAPPEESAP